MRVVIAGDFPDDTTEIVGGIQAVIYYTLEGLAQYDDLDIHVVTCEKPSRASRFGRFTAKHSQHGATYQSHHLPASPRLPHTISMLTTERKRVRTAIKALQPDIIHAHGQAAPYPWAAFDTGIPTIVTVHGINGLEAQVDQRGGRWRSRLRTSIWNAVERACVKRASDIVTISPFVEKYIAPFTNARLHPIENPVESALFDLPRDRIAPHSILYVGSIQKRKGLYDLIKAVGHLHKWRIPVQLRVAGDIKACYAEYADACKRLIADLGLSQHVTFLGHLDRERLLKEYDRCAVFCLPSYLEASSVSIAEAMAAGCPVVTTAIPSSDHLIVEGQTGYRFLAGDDVALAEVLHKVVANHAHGAFLGGLARERARSRFSSAKSAEATHDLYYDCLSRHKSVVRGA